MQKLIKISDTHYIVVDDSEIQENDWYIGWHTNYTTEPKNRWVIYCKSTNCNGNPYYKITHSTQPELLDNGWMQSVKPLLLSEVEEAIYGYSVEKMADRATNLINKSLGITTTLKDWYKEGFKAHQELVKGKFFSVDDMKKSYTAGWMNKLNKEEIYIDGFNKFIQSLLSKTEWNIKFNEQGKLALI